MAENKDDSKRYLETSMRSLECQCFHKSLPMELTVGTSKSKSVQLLVRLHHSYYYRLELSLD